MSEQLSPEQAVLDVIARTIWMEYGPYEDRKGRDASDNVAPKILAALCAAPDDVKLALIDQLLPKMADTIRLGLAVERRAADPYSSLAIVKHIYADAGVERP